MDRFSMLRTGQELFVLSPVYSKHLGNTGKLVGNYYLPKLVTKVRKDYFVLYGIGRFDKIKGHCLEKGLSSLRAYYEFDIDGDGNTVTNQKAEYDRASKIEQLVDQINHDMTRYAVNNQALDVEELESLLILLNKNKLQYRRTKKELSR